MKMSQEDAILIKNVCQSGMLHKGCWVNSSTTAGNLEALTVCWRESTRWVVQFCGNRAASDSIWCVAVEDLVLSQKDKLKCTD